MATRRPEGAALLVAGYGTPGTPALDASALHTLGQIGEALLATGAAWQIRRLTPTAGERYTADRATLKRHLDELAVEPVRVAVVALLGTIVDVDGAPALVTGAQAREYPEDATLPLAWIRDRLDAAKAEHMVAVVSARGDGNASAWLGALGTHRATHVIAVDAPGDGNPLIDALLTGLCGDALDPRTGTVTISSLCKHVTRNVPEAMVQGSTASETLAQPPPLAGFWDVRRSQLANRIQRPRAPGEPEDLTGAVLPGRFRIDRLVARGTFGTVYRARQLAVERDVAVKVLHADIDPSSEDGRLFVHEIRSVGRIDHPAVVRIHQADITHDGRLFFAMELLDGRDLQHVGSNGRLPRERAIELVRQLLAGLGAAHDAGLVHADVKPANAIVVAARKSGGELLEGNGNGESERLVLVDFGLARLRSPDRPAESAGGTPAYMAPEQLHEGRVDARSDLYAAGLVLVFLLTGWRRTNAVQLLPPLDTIEDADLRAIIARALEADPAKRFQTARELAGALTGHNTPLPQITQPTPLVPFRHLAPLTESDRGRLHGRAADLAVLTEHVLFRRSVIYTAPSGTGKTSLLRAGLLPRLEALGISGFYLRCRKDCEAELAKLIAPGTATIADAIAVWHDKRAGKLVLVLDQLETALAEPGFVPAILGFAHWPVDADVSIVLSVREDYLARLVARTQELEPGMPIVRLPPLTPDGARSAILAPLTESRLAIEPELLDALLDDLERAATAIGPEMGWGGVRAVYPPHLQLACTVLYEALGPGEATVTLAHYRRLGGFDAIVGEHLERVLDTELHDGRDVIARDLFVALVTTAQERAMRPESELLAIVGTKHSPGDVTAVLEILRSRGLLVRVRGKDEPGWELVHDSLVPRVLAWIDARDLARRRAIELVRYHLRRSTRDAPSLLDRRELRELRTHAGAIEELDAEWRARGTDDPWTPTALVAQSRRVLRARTLAIAGLVAIALAVGIYGWVSSRKAERRGMLDLGELVLELVPYGWDHVAQRAIPVDPTSIELAWQLYTPNLDAVDQPGTPFPDEWIEREEPTFENGARVQKVQAHGGAAFLAVSRGKDCPPSIVPIVRIPGNSERARRTVYRVHVPTCDASFGNAALVPAGPFWSGGPGEPASSQAREPARPVDLPAFHIDRVEVPNAAFSIFASMAEISGFRAHEYPPDTPMQQVNAGSRKPVTGITVTEARAYCRFHGKRLPKSDEWEKAMRGGVLLADHSRNPRPYRNLPWGAWMPWRMAGPWQIPMPARINEDPKAVPPGPADVGSYPFDVSPYGVLDLGGNATEWTETKAGARFWVVRGGNYGSSVATADDVSSAEQLWIVDAISDGTNVRDERHIEFLIGMRCASN